MLITTRRFATIAELKEMIKGFTLLFGVKPDIRIEVRGKYGNPTAAHDFTTDELVFFPSGGLPLRVIGHKYLSVALPDSTAAISTDDDRVYYHAAFYLP